MKNKLPKRRLRPARYVEYVVQDCPILGKKVVRHQLTKEK